MKRAILLLLALIMILPSAEAKRRESEEEIARKTRHYEGWEWGASGRLNLLFYEMDYMHIKGQKSVSSYEAHAKFGGGVLVNGGYLINNHWKVGAEVGVQIQYDYTTIPLYVTAHYYYGKRKNCFFNFLNLGTNALFDKGIRFGATGAGGVGLRLQSPDKDYKIDLTLGYQVLMINPRPELTGDFSFDKRDVSRKRLDQSVFIGIGISF